MPKNLKSMALVACVVGFSSSAMAETATDTIDVYAGLESVLKLECSDINFGVWRVPTGFRATTHIHMAADGSTEATVSNSPGAAVDERVSLSTEYDLPSASTCNVTGSQVGGEGITGTASFFDDSGTGQLVPGTYTGATNYPAAASTDDGLFGFTYVLSFSQTAVPITLDGTATFTIFGRMGIPGSVSAENYGAYKSRNTVSIQFDDSQQISECTVIIFETTELSENPWLHT